MIPEDPTPTPAPARRRVFRQRSADKAWQRATVVFALCFLVLCCALALPPSQRLGLAALLGPIVLFLGWLSYSRFRHRNDRVEVDESQIVYIGPDQRSTLRWDEVVEIKAGVEYLTLRSRNVEARREMRIPYSNIAGFDELFLLIHRCCPVGRLASRGHVTLPWVFRERQGKRVLRWTASGALLLLALGLLLLGNFVLLMVGLLLLVADVVLVVLDIRTPSMAMVTNEGVAMRSLFGSWELRYDEIEEIAPGPFYVRVVGRGRAFAFVKPGDSVLATYDLLVTAWESAGQGKKRAN